MSKVMLSDALFEQLGGRSWLTRPGYFLQTNKVESESFTPQLNTVEEQTFSVQTIESESQSLTESDESVYETSAQLPQETHVVQMSQQESVNAQPSVVLLGAGLDSVWQNEDNQAWALWQNIMKAFDWDDSQVVFFDTELLASEDMVFSTMEEVIDLGVEWVLTMDESHEISEQLAEGVQVLCVPEFESMLSEPYAKQSFYQTVISVTG